MAEDETSQQGGRQPVLEGYLRVMFLATQHVRETVVELGLLPR